MYNHDLYSLEKYDSLIKNLRMQKKNLRPIFVGEDWPVVKVFWYGWFIFNGHIYFKCQNTHMSTFDIPKESLRYPLISPIRLDSHNNYHVCFVCFNGRQLIYELDDNYKNICFLGKFIIKCWKAHFKSL